MSGRYGELIEDGDRAVITFVRRLAHPIEAVWSAIAEPGSALPGSARRR